MAEILPTLQSMSKPSRYWHGPGTETCHHCTHTYVLQMEYRCTGCDRGVCEQCALVVRETSEVFCRECTEEEAAG